MDEATIILEIKGGEIIGAKTTTPGTTYKVINHDTHSISELHDAEEVVDTDLYIEQLEEVW